MMRDENSEKRGAKCGALRLGYALGVLIPSVLLLAYSIRYHEPWVDSAQTLLLGRYVPWSGFIHALRLEGAPPLYHLLNWFLCLFLKPPVALALAGTLGYATLLVGTLHLLRIVSGRPWASLVGMLLLAATNVYVYELGVVSRPYGMGLGLILLGIAELLVAHRLRRPRRAVYGALFCGLAAMTSAHAGCVAGATLASYTLVQWGCRRSFRAGLPTFVALPFFLFLFYLISPYAQRTPEVATAGNSSFRNAWTTMLAVTRSAAVVHGWWTQPSFSLWAEARVAPPLLAALGIIAVTAVRRQKKDRSISYFILGFVVLSWLTLLYIFVAWYTGGSRHHLFLSMPAMVLAFGWLLGVRPLRRRLWVTPAVALVFWVPWWVYQAWVVRIDLMQDVARPFTDTKANAALLPPNAHVVADHDYAILGMRLWREDVTLRSPDRLGKPFDYLIVDREWHQRVGFNSVVRDACRQAPDRTMLVHTTFPMGALGVCLRPVRRGEAGLRSERGDLFQVDCGCLSK